MINTVINGDCLDVMKDIQNKSVDMILCDLPYGTSACKWDIIIPFDKLWEQYLRIIKDNSAIVLFGSQPFTSSLIMSNVKMYKCMWLWEKERPSNFFQAKFVPLNNIEDVIVFSSAGTNNGTKNPIKYYPQGVQKSKNTRLSSTTGGKIGKEHGTKIKSGEFYAQCGEGYPFRLQKFTNDINTVHPTQKPVALFEYLIRTYTNEGDTVLDNCAGSGTTAIACLNTKRNYICIEKEEKYFDIINKRIEKHLQENKQ